MTNEDIISDAAKRALASAKPRLERDEEISAQKAVREAVAVVGHADFNEDPWVGFTDDGALMVQWQRDDKGVLLSFTGDGVFAIAVKSGPYATYSAGYREQTTTDGLPPDIRAEISRLSEPKK